MTVNKVQSFYDEQIKLILYLQGNHEVSFALTQENLLQKNLPLAVASFFESQINRIIEEYINKHSGGESGLVAFLKNQALVRKYHTMFDWNQDSNKWHKGVNKFFSLFGDEINEAAKKQIANDNELKDACSAFIEIGQLRNKIVHENYIEFDQTKTANEVYDLFEKAMTFISYVSQVLGLTIDKPVMDTPAQQAG